MSEEKQPIRFRAGLGDVKVAPQQRNEKRIHQIVQKFRQKVKPFLRIWFREFLGLLEGVWGEPGDCGEFEALQEMVDTERFPPPESDEDVDCLENGFAVLGRAEKVVWDNGVYDSADEGTDLAWGVGEIGEAGFVEDFLFLEYFGCAGGWVDFGGVEDVGLYFDPTAYKRC
ncbi:hypothetical protein EX30DRAFT_10282 [Ascodesmis nigricans]|uniref:Uncharacterized protein n=1 Tax=Ascodesmis nigricans TaxID=341454 RepID=A0A4S2N6V6_9PEZI|nr:hypothetical protein EX30DRAFT_10282 [Ascodesmis nigricans]